MEERPRQDVTDGKSLWCRQCKTRKSVFFQNRYCLLSLYLVQQMKLRLHGAQPLTFTSGFVRCAPQNSWEHQLYWVEQEVLFKSMSHWLKVRRKYTNQAWVIILKLLMQLLTKKFGCLAWSHTPALGYMDVVQQCTGTEVHSDDWRAYPCDNLFDQSRENAEYRRHPRCSHACLILVATRSTSNIVSTLSNVESELHQLLWCRNRLSIRDFNTTV